MTVGFRPIRYVLRHEQSHCDNCRHGFTLSRLFLVVQSSDRGYELRPAPTLAWNIPVVREHVTSQRTGLCEMCVDRTDLSSLPTPIPADFEQPPGRGNLAPARKTSKGWAIPLRDEDVADSSDFD